MSIETDIKRQILCFGQRNSVISETVSGIIRILEQPDKLTHENACNYKKSQMSRKSFPAKK